VRLGPRHRREERLAPQATGRVFFDGCASVGRESTFHPRRQRFRIDTLIRRLRHVSFPSSQ
jgi:hypothetical protein